MRVEDAAPVNELPNLDLLRALAVLLVVADHVLETIDPRVDAAFSPLDWHLGRLGVLLFFVHTSLVLMQSLARTPARGSKLFAHFYVRRVFRIYPLSVFCVAIVLGFGVPRAAWEAPGHVWSYGTVLSNLLLTQNLTYSPSVLAPMWSLPYEMQMYVALPFLFVLMHRASIGAVALGGWVAAVLAALVQPLVPGFTRLDVAQFGPCFLAGVVAYAGLLRVSPRLPSWSWPVILLSLVAAYLAVALNSAVMHPRWLGWIYCALVGLLIPCFHQISSPALVVTSHLLAKYSYGIYLFHLVALWIAFGVLPVMSVWQSAAVAALLCMLLAIGAHHLIEKPFINLGGRVARRLISRTPPL
jgi:peptidoglycan/LPS O-acetylase OafA/YrhL